jgi:hypothetical protein
MSRSVWKWSICASAVPLDTLPPAVFIEYGVLKPKKVTDATSG